MTAEGPAVDTIEVQLEPLEGGGLEGMAREAEGGAAAERGGIQRKSANFPKFGVEPCDPMKTVRVGFGTRESIRR